MSISRIPEREIAERPTGYGGPNLSPVGLELVPHEFTPGVWALMANLPPKDNNGVITGRDAALVVDAGITPGVSDKIQAVVARLTGRPLRYLVNTTYHGDHTFGNAAFPREVVIVSSGANKANMTDLAYEKQTRSANMYGDVALLDEVTVWRTPDLTFDSFAEIDLGGRVVQLHHFGPGNGPGDTIVYVPDARTAGPATSCATPASPTCCSRAAPNRIWARCAGCARPCPIWRPSSPGTARWETGPRPWTLSSATSNGSMPRLRRV